MRLGSLTFIIATLFLVSACETMMKKEAQILAD